MNKKEYKELLNCEVYRNKKKFLSKIFNKYFNPSTASVYLLRKMQYYSNSNFILKKIYGSYLYSKLVKTYGIQVNPSTKIGIGLHFPHPISIVIGAKVKIGKNVSIYQNTTLGGSRKGDVLKGNQPEIGDYCVIFSGSSILGKVKLEDNCILGANSLLLNSTAKNEIWVGAPARKVKNNEIKKS